MSAYVVELLGILIALGLLIFLAFRGFSLLLAAPAAAIVAAAFSGEPLLAKWTRPSCRVRQLHRKFLPALPARGRIRQAHG